MCPDISIHDFDGLASQLSLQRYSLRIPPLRETQTVRETCHAREDFFSAPYMRVANMLAGGTIRRAIRARLIIEGKPQL